MCKDCIAERDASYREINIKARRRMNAATISEKRKRQYRETNLGEASRAYSRAYHKQHPEKVRERVRRWTNGGQKSS